MLGNGAVSVGAGLGRLATVTSPGRRGRTVFVYDAGTEVGKQRFVSIIDPATVFSTGLCAEAIIGVVLPGAPDGPLSPEAFRPNPLFVDYLRRLIAEHVDHVAAVRLQAHRQGSGYVYLVDGRTPTPDGVVPPEDVIGAVAVEAGTVVAGSYRHNPNHQLLTHGGFFVLPAELEAVLQSDLRVRCERLGRRQ